MDKKLITSIVLTIVYAIITFIAVLNHETWADEVQVWQLCHYLSIPELINHLHNEGHPILFYLLVMPFAKLNLNIIFPQIICWFAMCTSIFIFIYYSPFKYYTKLAIILSAGFIYFLPVIARNYSLIPILVFLAAILYSKQKQHPILYALSLAFLANIHIIMFVFVFILGCYFIYDNIIQSLKSKRLSEIKTNIYSAVIIFFGLLLITLQLHNTTSLNSCVNLSVEDLPFKILKTFSSFFINSYNNTITINDCSPIDILITITLASIFIMFFINLFINSKRLFFLAFLSIGFQFAIYVFAYSVNMYVTRIFSAFTIIIYCFWILYKENKFKTKLLSNKFFTNIIITLFFALTIYNGTNFYVKELKYNYSGGKEAAKYIKDNLNPNALYLIDNEPFSLALVYYLKDEYKLHSVIRNKPLRYVVWDDKIQITLLNIALKTYCESIPQNIEEVYVIKSKVDERINMIQPIENEFKENFELLYSTGYTIEPNEGYKIYKYIR